MSNNALTYLMWMRCCPQTTSMTIYAFCHKYSHIFAFKLDINSCWIMNIMLSSLNCYLQLLYENQTILSDSTRFYQYHTILHVSHNGEKMSDSNSQYAVLRSFSYFNSFLIEIQLRKQQGLHYIVLPRLSCSGNENISLRENVWAHWWHLHVVSLFLNFILYVTPTAMMLVSKQNILSRDDIWKTLNS